MGGDRYQGHHDYAMQENPAARKNRARGCDRRAGKVTDGPCAKNQEERLTLRNAGKAAYFLNRSKRQNARKRGSGRHSEGDGINHEYRAK